MKVMEILMLYPAVPAVAPAPQSNWLFIPSSTMGIWKTCSCRCLQALLEEHSDAKPPHPSSVLSGLKAQLTKSKGLVSKPCFLAALCWDISKSFLEKKSFLDGV